MTTTAQSIITQAQELTQDEDGVAYTTAQGVAWVNDGQRAIAAMRPDLFVTTVTFQLAAGSKQSIPAAYTALNGLISNMGTDGLTPGAGITGPVAREDVDAFISWRGQDQQAYTYQYMYHDETPTTFWVYPPSDGTGYVEAELVRVPTDCADENSNIDLDDIYSPALVEWLVFRWWERDSEETPNAQRSAAALQRMMNFIQAEGVKGAEISARVAEYVK